MPERSSPRGEAPPNDAQNLPRPVAPPDGALVDARAVPFEWSEAGTDGEYVVQVALDPDFDELVTTLSAGETTAMTLYHTLDRFDDSDLYWRVGLGDQGPWGPAASFHAAGAERLNTELTARDRAARQEAQKALQKHLEGEHRMPVVLPDETSSDRKAALILGILVVSFIILLIILFIFGQITYPAEAVV